MSRRHEQQRNPEAAARFKQSGHRFVGYILAFLLGGALVTGAVLMRTASQPVQPSAAARPLLSSYYDLLAMTPGELGKVDVALMNLLCAKGLPGAENLDIPAVLTSLDEWAAKVKSETQRHLYRASDPKYAAHYNHSEARLRAEFIVQVLQEDCGVHYNMKRVRQVDFSKPADLFIHGMVDNPNGGTCSSMPVLYATIGRRLGYPIKLVLAKDHVFCRWDDGKERFNIEGAGNGGVDYPPDEYYRTWPLRMSDAELASGEFLRSLTPQEELASFLLQRAACLKAHGRVPEERACLAEASQLMPKSGTLQMALRSTFGRNMSPQVVQRPPFDESSLPPSVRASLPPDPTPRTPLSGVVSNPVTPHPQAGGPR